MGLVAVRAARRWRELVSLPTPGKPLKMRRHGETGARRGALRDVVEANIVGCNVDGRWGDGCRG